MPAPPLDSWAADSLQRKLHERHGLTHIRVRKRGKVLTLESGPEGDAQPHARFRRDTVHLWWLEMPDRNARWEKTPFRGPLDDLIELLVNDFGWMVEDVLNQGATSDPKY